MSQQEGLDLGLGNPLLVDAETLAEVLGVSRSLVHKLHQKHGMPKERRGQWHLPTCVQFYLSHTAGQSDEDSGDARTELYRAQTSKHRLEIAEKRRELLPRSEVESVLFSLAGIFSEGMEALPAREAGALALMDDGREIQNRLGEACRGVRDSVARRIEEFTATLSSPDDADLPPAPQLEDIDSESD
ncbi:MAG: hypothetical protein ACQES2_00645 [Pseudomonadota bacterium]